MGRRSQLAKRRLYLRLPSGPLRTLPDFLLIGAQRAGTSSLYRYLGSHPDIARSLRKETEYFTRRFHHRLTWYRAHFPLRARRQIARIAGAPFLTFEATPDYLFYPLAARRVASVLPDVKLVVLLRDPAERALSQWQHMVRLGYEDLPFPEAIAREEERIGPDLDALGRDPSYEPKLLLRFSYALRGRYDEQLSEWLRWFPPDRFLVMQSEAFYANPAVVYPRLIEFLGVRPHVPADFPNHSAAAEVETTDGQEVQRTLDLLRERFEPSQRRLAGVLARLHGGD